MVEQRVVVADTAVEVGRGAQTGLQARRAARTPTHLTAPAAHLHQEQNAERKGGAGSAPK